MHNVFVVWFQNALCLWFGFRMHNDNMFVVSFRMHSVCGLVSGCTVCLWFLSECTVFVVWFQNAQCVCGLVSECKMCLWFGFRMHNVFEVWFQNAQCVCDLVSECTMCVWFGFRMHNVLGLYTACGFNVLLVEYRGYGRSEGSPSENGV